MNPQTSNATCRSASALVRRCIPARWWSIYPHFKPAYSVVVWTARGGHGGSDRVMLQDIFSPSAEPDKYLRRADQRAGAYSILTGIAANQSMATGQLVTIDSLAQDIGRPDYPPMPSRQDPLPLA